MKTIKILLAIALNAMAIIPAEKAYSQWNFLGINIYNTNAGEVGIHTMVPAYPLQIFNPNNKVRTFDVNHVVALGVLNSGIAVKADNGGNGATYGVYSLLPGGNDNFAGDRAGFYTDVAQIGNGIHYGLRSNLTAGGGTLYGTYSNITPNSTASHFGTYNSLSGTGNGSRYGDYATITSNGDGIHTGYYASLSGTGNGTQYGVRAWVTNSGTATHYGLYSYVSTAGSGTHYGVYSNAQGSGNYSFYGLGRGYFSDNVGIRTIPEITGLHVEHDYGVAANGLRIQNSAAAGHEWTLYTANDNNYLEFVTGGVMEVRFTDDGTLDEISDARRKTDVDDLSAILDKVNRLKPRTFRFINKPKDSRKSIGFIAQELEKVFPEFVHYGGDGEKLYSVNYAGLSVIALKAIQELSKTNEELQQQNSDQEKRIEKLESVIYAQSATSSSSQSSKTISVTDALLEQNIPNPFTNSTTIHYTLPQKFAMAKIVIADINGKVLKQANLSGSGKGTLNVNAATLSAGAYNYSLVIDGKIIANKKMVVAK